MFFIDFVGHQEDDVVREALKEVEEKAVYVKYLGSYPRAVL